MQSASISALLSAAAAIVFLFHSPITGQAAEHVVAIQGEIAARLAAQGKNAVAHEEGDDASLETANP